MSTDKVKGTVVRFLHGRGFGFIKPDDGGEEVFVHWEDLVTDERFPHIEEETEVEFLMGERDGKCAAREVSLVGGEKFPAFVYEDRVVNEDDIFVGSVKFFDNRRGFGFIKLDEEISWEGTSSGDAVYFPRDSLIGTDMSKDMDVKVPTDIRVSFRVYKDDKGLGACEVQNEDGSPLESVPRGEWKGETRKRKRTGSTGANKKAKKAKTKDELIEEREVEEEGNIYTGTVKFYKPDKGYGFIKIDEEITLKDLSAKGKIYVMKEDIVCYSDEVGLTPNTEVMFKIYKDSMGIGACEVMNVDGTPIELDSQSKEAEADKVPSEAEADKEPSPEPVKPKKKPTAKGKKKAEKPKKKPAKKKLTTKGKKKIVRKKAVKRKRKN